MRIGLYGTRWPYFIECHRDVLLRFGHDAHVSSVAEECFNDDLTILFTFDGFVHKVLSQMILDIPLIKQHSKYVLFFNSEHLFSPGAEFHKRHMLSYRDNFDGVLNMFPEINDAIIEWVGKPSYLLPHACYDESLTTCDVIPDLVCPADILKLDGQWGHNRIAYNKRLEEEKLDVTVMLSGIGIGLELLQRLRKYV